MKPSRGLRAASDAQHELATVTLSEMQAMLDELDPS